MPIYEVGAAFLRAFPWGSFLADGAYKQVWRVWNAAGRRMEAVSVMDVAALAPTGNLPVIATEIQVGCMLAELVRSHVCPNFVQTHQVFLQAHAPHIHFPWWWGTAEVRAPHGSTCPFTPAMPSMTHAEGLSAVVSTAEVDCAHAPDSAKLRQGDKSARQSRKLSNTVDVDTAVSALDACLHPECLPASAAAIARGAGGDGTARPTGVCSILSTFARFGSGELRIGMEEPTTRGRAGRQCEPGLFQYIRMELCDGGDLETWLRAVEPAVLAAEARLASAAVVMPAAGDVGIVNEAEGRVPRERARSRAPAAVAAVAPVAEAASLEGDGAGTHLRQLDEAAAAMFRSYLFQMAFSLYTARERFNLRHYDVKLLNFFIQSAGVSKHPGREEAADALTRGSGLRYHLGPMVFELPLGLPTSGDPAAALRPQHIVKLADYGTADVRAATLGLPIKPYHLTTLENAAPEMLYLGAACPQSFSTADTWALGLCAVHLLTGAAPYEELLSELHCPPLLRKEITRLWMTVPCFTVLRAVLADDAEDVLVNTLYRVLVLTSGVPPRSYCGAGSRDNAAGAEPAVGLGQHARANPLCELLQFVITGRHCPHIDASESVACAGSAADVPLPSSVRPSRAAGKRATGAGAGSTKPVRGGLTGSKLTAAQLAAAHRVYLEHAGEFSMRAGTNPALARARRRMALTEGAKEAVEHLMQLDPQRRPTMLTLLQAPLFTPLRSHSLARNTSSFHDFAAFSCDAATSLANV
jgi:serine/threonine protein kinase